jgi:tRNA U34 2-thiouridine synthase MnmA/TrmU
MLAIRIMQEQGIEVEALNFKTVFTCCQDRSAQTASDLGVRLTVVGQEDDYLDLVKEPQFGRGKGANPCVDCRIYMFEKAKRFMHQIGADFIVSGEVAGQRPMSQKRRDLDRIAFHSDLDDLLLRPLSAKLLRPTLPEREGWVDREKLYNIEGRSRKRLIALAKKYGLKEIPTPSTGCSLTEPRFSKKVFDLIDAPGESRRWDFELLKIGRHFRFDAHTKVVLGRDEAENDQLLYANQLPDATNSVAIAPENFVGPQVLFIGPRTDEAIHFAASLMLRYSREYEAGNALVRVDDQIINASENERAKSLETIATM